MLLSELTISNKKRIAKINATLKESYGFTLKSDVKVGQLRRLHEKVTDDLYKLKLNQSTARDKEFVEKLLVQEGLSILLQEAQILSGPGGRAFQRVITWLAGYVRSACEVGDDYDEAIYEAMKEYRSSKFRFDDDVVEYELRKATEDCSPLEECGIGMVYEEEECNVCKCDPCECDKLEEDTPKKVKRPTRWSYGQAMRKKKPRPAEEMKEEEINEVAPPGMEDWIKDRKPEFKKRYGDRWEEVLYATAWKQHNKNESVEEKWDTETKTPKSERGKYKGKTVEELRKSYNALKDKENKTEAEKERMHELSFAIRAKTGWGKVNEEDDIRSRKLSDLEVARAILRNVKSAFRYLAEARVTRDIKAFVGQRLKDIQTSVEDYKFDETKNKVNSLRKEIENGEFIFELDEVIYDLEDIDSILQQHLSDGVLVADDVEEAFDRSDRYASRDWIRNIKKDKAKAAGDYDLELALAEPDDDDEPQDYFAYRAQKGKKLK